MDTQRPHARGFSFDSAATWAFSITVGLAAIAFIPAAAIPFYYTKVSLMVVGAIVTLALFILARLTRGNIIVPPALLVGALWLVPLAYALSTLFSGTPAKLAFFGAELESDTFGFIVLAALLGTLAALALRRREHIERFTLVLAAAAGIVLVAEVVFFLLGQAMPNTISATANLVGSYADLGVFLGLGLVCAMLALRLLPLSSRMRIALMVGGAVALFFLVLVNTFLIWVLVGLAALGLFIEAIMRRTIATDEADLEGVATIPAIAAAAEDGPRSIAAPLVVLVVALFFLVGGSTVGTALASALHSSVLDVRPSWSATFGVGSHTYATSPMFGTGPGTFGADFLKYRDPSLNTTPFWNIDFTSGVGFVPTSFVTTGAVGAIAWIAFFALFLFIGARFLLVGAPTDPFLRFVSLASFVGAAYLFALAVFSVPGPFLIALAFVLAGLFISSTRYGDRAREWGVAFARSPRIGFVIVFALTLILLGSVLAVYVAVERYLADIAYAEGTAALTAGDLDAAAADAARSILFASSDRAYRLSSSVGLARLNQIAGDTTLTADEARSAFQAALSTSISDAITSTQLGAQNYQNWVALGNVYAAVVPLNIDGAYDNAKTAYEHAIALNPTNPSLPYVMAELDIEHKDPAAGEADLNQAISLKHDYTDAIFLLSELEVQEGKAKEALQAAEAAAYFAPTDPTVLFQVGLLRFGTGDTDGAIAAFGAAVKANPQYANAHYFLAAAYAAKKDYADAIDELETVGSLSTDNAAAVASDISVLKTGKDPFPAATLPQAPVEEPGAPEASQP